MRLEHAGSWCERRDLNPHGCPPDPKSGASAIPPLSHSAAGQYSENYSIYIYFRLASPNDLPGKPLSHASRKAEQHTVAFRPPPDSEVGSSGLPGAPGSGGLPLRYAHDLRPLAAVPLAANNTSLHRPLPGTPRIPSGPPGP